ncbi:MAG: Mur ligase family protein [Acidimicrobiales bacterium]
MNGSALGVATLVAGVVAGGVTSLRWLRVAQREHYLAGPTSQFALRWWATGRINPVLAILAVGALAASVAVTPLAMVAAVVSAAGPLGLALRGRTSPLVWTPRLRALAAAAAAVAAAPIFATAAIGSLVADGGLRPAAVVACGVALAWPVAVDVALVATAGLERRRLAPFVAQARRRLASVAPVVVAVTGSYGKTSTKQFVAHLLGGTRSVVPSPRSFNNRAGLATAINQHLTPGTEVFVAEMGTYGPGEIAALCDFVPPDVAVITALGPVHLSRMGSEERIAAAKAEILVRAPAVVINVAHPALATLADRAQVDGKQVWRVGSVGAARPGAPPLDVAVEATGSGLVAHVRGTAFPAPSPPPGSAPQAAAPGNVACALAVALQLGVPAATAVARLADLPAVEHRQAVLPGANGQLVIDDTYNANPAGAAAALALLERLAPGGGRRRVVVTPGMVELGWRQAGENAAFAAAAAAVATHLVVVGATNAGALLAGAQGGVAQVVRARSRAWAVAWVAANTGPGDAVLYENDLPDHFP